MVEPVKKSTEGSHISRQVVWSHENTSVILDGRLALFGSSSRSPETWLAVSDLHFGYEVERRANGGLWPLWGRETIQHRLERLLSDYSPHYLIMNGDIIDGAAAGNREAIDWLKHLSDRCENLVLIKGNHDRGRVLREFPFRDYFQINEFLFHHGHDPTPETKLEFDIEITGHVHPATRFSDGAGLSVKLPLLVQEPKHWIMPAFSPWAGGVRICGTENSTHWACSPKRVFELVTADDA